MSFKLNISDKGKAWRLQTEAEALVGKNLGDKVEGKDISADLEGYELEITGGSDGAGFPIFKDVEGIGLKGVMFTKGWGMKNKKSGLRLRKTVRGKTISPAISQINLKVLKHGKKHLNEIFPDQNKAKEAPKKEEAAPAA